MFKLKHFLAAAVAILAIAGAISISNPASAASIHLKGGAHAEPAFTDNGVTLTASGALAGLGNGDVEVTLTANGNIMETCTNPSGKKNPPGQNRGVVSVVGSLSIPVSEIKNGTAPFAVTTLAPVIDPGVLQGCPNPQWINGVTIAFTSAHLQVDQAGGGSLGVDCTFTPPTDNGRVPAGNVSCS